MAENAWMHVQTLLDSVKRQITIPPGEHERLPPPPTSGGEGAGGGSGRPGTTFFPPVGPTSPYGTNWESGGSRSWGYDTGGYNRGGDSSPSGLGLAAGGTVPGGYGGGDSVPAMLEPGEEVTHKSAARKNRSVLKAIARGESPMGGDTHFHVNLPNVTRLDDETIEGKLLPKLARLMRRDSARRQK